MASGDLEARRKAYAAAAADLMREAAEIVARPDPDAGAFAALQWVAERGRAMDPVAAAHVDIRQGVFLAPLFLASGLLSAYAFATVGWADLGSLRWVFVSMTAAFLGIGLFVAGLVARRRSELRAIAGLPGTRAAP